ncbi:NAF1-domain-containing protein [Mycena belliarum]|uniref:H/ACA ribonucleoprotein complex non-core subunit NAF1 n=1 Tax=Mycena belliarum TaxID=1033014 RepID=A0AAD6UI46_9AGAR|nr:NAF1-domain-containing protein [Mycena belliae]
MSFLVPTVVPQDLLLIQDLIGAPQPASPPKPPALKLDNDIDSSGSENESENEVEADLVKVEEEDSKLSAPIDSAPVDSTSESDSSSDSDSSESDEEPSKVRVKALDAEDDDELGVVAPTATYFQTKNELVEADIVVPDIEEVGADETLERVGEIMSIVDKTVIIKGAPTDIASPTLDCDTLLVFEDRKVLGYIYETFGPTTQPLYQVKFSAIYPLDQDRVQLSRPIFHVPRRSKFVSLNQLKKYRGSDASNMHDEEPADDELEFSDDEAEAAHRRNSKRKRESRANSVAGSRQSTPSLMRDQDMAFMERNPYDDYSLYDDNFGGGPSRPAPMPYDDPYSDEYNNAPANFEHALPAPPRSRANSFRDEFDGPSARSRGRGRGSGSERQEGRGRGRGRGERGKGARGRGSDNRAPRQERNWDARASQEPYAPQPPSRPLSPTSMAIARATGQYSDGSDFSQPGSAPTTPAAAWGFEPSHQLNFGYQPHQQSFQVVQPHINPRFASAFGLNLDFQQQTQGYYPPAASGSSWTDEWTVHSASNNEPQ